MSGFLETKLCLRGFDKRTNRCRIIKKKHPGSSHLNSIRLPVPSENVAVNFHNSNVTWYSVIVPTTGTLQADTESTLTNIDTKICIYNSDGSLFWQNNDSNNEPNPYLSNVSAPVTAGTYYIVVGFHGMQFGENFTITTNNIQPQNGVLLSVTFTPQPPVAVPGLSPTPWTDPGVLVPNWNVVYSPLVDYTYQAEGYYGDTIAGGPGYGKFSLQTTFDLTAFDVTTVILNINVEGGATEILLNGTNIFSLYSSNFFIAKSSGISSIFTGEGSILYNSPNLLTLEYPTGFIQGLNTITISKNGYSMLKVNDLRAVAVPIIQPIPPPQQPLPPSYNPPKQLTAVTGTPWGGGGDLIPDWTVTSSDLQTYQARTYYGTAIRVNEGALTEFHPGPFDITTTFDLSGYDVSTVVFQMFFGTPASNIENIVLNGTDVLSTLTTQYYVIKSFDSVSVRTGEGETLYNTPKNLPNNYSVGFINGLNTITFTSTHNYFFSVEFKMYASPNN